MFLSSPDRDVERTVCDWAWVYRAPGYGELGIEQCAGFYLTLEWHQYQRLYWSLHVGIWIVLCGMFGKRIHRPRRRVDLGRWLSHNRYNRKWKGLVFIVWCQINAEICKYGFSLALTALSSATFRVGMGAFLESTLRGILIEMSERWVRWGGSFTLRRSYSIVTRISAVNKTCVEQFK